MWKWLIAGLAIVGAIFGVVQARKSVAPAPIPKLLRDPVRNPFEKGIAGSGIVEPSSENIVIGVPEPGMVTAVFVVPNQAVEKDQKLFSIDSRLLQSQRLSLDANARKAKAALVRAQSVVASAKAELQRVKSFRRKEDEAGLRAKVEQAEAAILEARNAVIQAEATAAQQPINIADAENELARLEKIERNGASAKELTEHQRFVVQLEKAKLLTARAAVETAKSRINSGTAAHAAAKAELDTFLAGAWEPDIQRAAATVGEADAGVIEAEAAVEAANTELTRIDQEIERRTVRSPIAGTVLRVNLRVNEYAMATAPSAETAPMVIGNLRPLHVRANIDEFDTQRFRPKTKAVGIPKGSDRRIPLEFVRVDPFVIPKRALTNSQREMVDTRVLEIIFKVADPDAVLYVGQQVDVFIEAE